MDHTVLINRNSGELVLGDERAKIGKQAVRILHLLIHKNGDYVLSAALSDAISATGSSAQSRYYVRGIISRLRKAFERIGVPDSISARQFYGYKLNCNVRFVGETPSIFAGTERQRRLIKRLIETCPSRLLAEQARQAVFG